MSQPCATLHSCGTMLNQISYKLDSLQFHILPCSCAMLVRALNTSDTAMQEPVTCHTSQGLELI